VRGYEQNLLAAHCARVPAVDSSSECDKPRYDWNLTH